MTNRQNKSRLPVTLLMLCTLIAILVVMTAIKFRKEYYNSKLIEQIKFNNAKLVLSSLAQGADANALDIPPDTRPIWHQLLDLWRGNKPSKNVPSALIVAVSVGINDNNPPDNDVIVKALLDKGAKSEVRDENDFTPMMIAAASGKIQTVRILIDRGANINASNDGTTPLMFAIQNGQEKVCNLLLDKGANLNVQDKYGRTALMRAISGQFDYAVKLLLTKKADVNLKAINGQTALSIAKSKMPDYVSILKQAGAIDQNPSVPNNE